MLDRVSWQLTSDDGSEFLRVTVGGAENVLKSCVVAARAGTLKRFVHCSSTSAVQDNSRQDGHVYSEVDWNETMSLARDPYSFSKVSVL